MSRRAFTLIELLVVIAIIAILVAILFPVFSSAREKGRQAACKSNLKQLAMAAFNYADDYDETLPPSKLCDLYPKNAVAAAANLLDPYVKSDQLWTCPSGPGAGLYICDGSVIGDASQTYEAGVKLCMHYSCNDQLMPPIGGWYSNYYWAVTFASIADPSATVMMFDHQPDRPDHGTYIDWYTWQAQEEAGVCSVTLHHSGTNIAWADGHVKYMKLDAVTAQMFTPAAD